MMSDGASLSLKDSIRFLKRYLQPQWLRLVCLMLFLLGGDGLALLTPQLLRQYIDLVHAQNAVQMLTILAISYLLSVLIGFILNIALAYFSAKVGWTSTNLLRADLVARCLDLDMSFHHTHTPGELIERTDGDIATLSNFFSQFILSILTSLFLLGGIIALLFREDWRIGLALLVFSLVTLLVMGKIRSLAVPYWKQTRQASADFFGFLEEGLSNREDIRAVSAHAYIMRRSFQLMRTQFRLERKASVMSSIITTTSITLFTIGYTLTFASGAYLFTTGAITLGTVYLIFQYMQMLEQPIQQITAQLTDLQRATASLKRVTELFQLQPTILDGPHRLPVGQAHSIDFEQVSFSYNQPTEVLHNLSFHVKAGETLGILGRTGSGKSTIARLLLRFYDPTIGSICLGDRSLQDLRLESLRSSVGIITQEVQLFHASIRDNLTLFHRTVDDGRILEILEDLGLGNWYRTLPRGLDTQLEGNNNLSAGEAQLLAFARIFLKNPGVIILDEASSRLDPATEQLIERAIDKLLQNRTGIIIAHRLATLRRASHILLLEHGQVREYDSRSRLENDPTTRYAQLLSEQGRSLL